MGNAAAYCRFSFFRPLFFPLLFLINEEHVF
jgi:hypothetical protein